jgi:hypothetical protein
VLLKGLEGFLHGRIGKMALHVHVEKIMPGMLTIGA